MEENHEDGGREGETLWYVPRSMRKSGDFSLTNEKRVLQREALVVYDWLLCATFLALTSKYSAFHGCFCAAFEVSWDSPLNRLIYRIIS